MSAPPQLPKRRFDLDWLRVIVFGLLIFYHIGMFYGPWPWHVKSGHAGEEIRPLMLATNPWRLSLLFLISGVATRFMADKLATGPLLRSRSVRLLPPLLFGMLVVVPPQTYCEVVEKLGFTGGWLEFYGKYLGFHTGWLTDGKRLIVPTWNHLWFVAYLWVYTVLAVGLVPLSSNRHLRSLGQWLLHLGSGPGLLLFPWLLLAAARLLLWPRFGETHALADDWYLHASYFALFLFGFGAAHAQPIWATMVRFRWMALGLAVCAWAGIVWLPQSLPAAVFLGLPAAATLPAVWALQQWAACVALLGFAQRWLVHDSRSLRYLTPAVFPFYILHQTAIVVVGHSISGLGLAAWVEAGIIVAATLTICWAGYELVKRSKWLRPFFGLTPIPEVPALPYRAGRESSPVIGAIRAARD